jgi:integrase
MSDLVFTTALGTPLDPRGVDHHMEAVCRRAGIEHAAPHALRRTFSGLAHAAGARAKNLQAVVGHATLAMTMDCHVGTKSDVDALPTPTTHATTVRTGSDSGGSSGARRSDDSGGIA